MEKLTVAALACALLGMPCYAQRSPAADVSAGYSYFNVKNSRGGNLNGVEASAAYYEDDSLGLVGDLAIYHGSAPGMATTTMTYMVGPRFSYRGSSQIAPFVQVLLGGAQLSAQGASSENHFAFSLAGGADIRGDSKGKLWVRPQVEYIGMRSSASPVKGVRISFGIVLHLGVK